MGKNNTILVSEYNMPSDFKCIWSKETLANFDCDRGKNKEACKRIERLFIYEN